MDPEKIMSSISKEILTALKVMAKAKTPDEKLKYSEIVKNLCESLGIFFDLINDSLMYNDDLDDDDDDDDDKPIPF